MFTTPRPAQRQQPGQHTGQPPVPEFKRPATVQRAVPAGMSHVQRGVQVPRSMPHQYMHIDAARAKHVSLAFLTALPSTPFAHAASPLSAAPPLSSTRPASTTSIGAGTFANATPSATGSSSSSTKVLLESDRRSLRTLSEEQVPAAVRALLDEMDLDGGACACRELLLRIT